MQTVLVANRKGGVGKTLVAITLAGALANGSERVALADADRQASSLGWLARRPGTVPRIRALDWREKGAVGDHPKKLDWLIIDAPGALKDTRAERLVAEARAVLVPIQPSFFDTESTGAFLDDIESIKRVRKGKVGLHLIANRVRPGTRAARALGDYCAELGHEPAAWISERAVYGDLAQQGLCLFDRSLKSLEAAKAQWRPLMTELTG